MKDALSAVIRISRFRHGEGGAGWGDSLISMADVARSALCAIAISASQARDRELNFSKLSFGKLTRGNRACPFLTRCGRSWRNI
jgi:hypothetical protein